MLQHQIADLMTVLIIDLLKVIDIDDYQTHRFFLGMHLLQHRWRKTKKITTIFSACQFIGMGIMAKFINQIIDITDSQSTNT